MAPNSPWDHMFRELATPCTRQSMQNPLPHIAKGLDWKHLSTFIETLSAAPSTEELTTRAFGLVL